MTEKEKMLKGMLYIAADEELGKEGIKAQMLTYEYNNTTVKQLERREEIRKELFKHIGKNSNIIPSFRCDYGCHISIGDDFFANYDCIIIDVCDVNIGNHVFLAPRVCIYTAAHPIDAEIRNTQLEYGKPVTIGNDVWVGGNTVINPGVTIGNNVVIGSGSVVTKDIPDNVIAVGNPCRVLRKITEEDKKYWEAKRQEYLNN